MASTPLLLIIKNTDLILKDNVIKEFANKGVNVRWYPERTHEEFEKRVWQTCFQAYIDYYKNHVKGCDAVNAGRANVLFQTFDELKERAAQNANREREYKRGYSASDSTVLYVEYSGRLIIQKINTRSKEITAEYIDKLIEKNDKAYNGYYGEFAEKMTAILTANGISDICVYPTQYGIGVWVIFNHQAEDDIKTVTDILEHYGVEYYNEYSEAGWVYRFKVSKKAANINKLTA